MRHARHGWPFLVARGRHVGYRAILAPPFLPGARAEALARATGAVPGGTAARIAELDDPHAGPLSVGYVGEQLTGADVADVASDELLTDDRGGLLDEHGRALEIVYGFVTRERLVAPLHPDDLATARAQAIASYARFLGDEDGHEVAASAPFALRTAARARPRGAGATGDDAPRAASGAAGATGDDAPRAASGAEDADPAGVRVPPVTRRRVLAGGAAALGAAVLAGALLAGQPSGPNRDRAVDPAWLDKPGGTVRLCTAGSPPAAQRRAVRDYNREARGSSAVLVKLAAARGTAGAAPAASLGRASRCDVVAADVVAMARLASQHLLYDLTPYLRAGDRQAAFDPRMIRAARYDGRLWGVPAQLDAAVLYYRADRVRAPRSWQDLYREARLRDVDGDVDGLRPRVSGESLTIVFLELAYAAGAQPVVSADGKTAHVDQPPTRAALAFLRQGIRDRVTPPGDAGGDGSASLYERGGASFLRAKASLAGRLLGRTTSGVRTAVSPLPPWRAGAKSVSILTGDELVIPRSARNPRGALHLVDFLTSAEQVREDAAPVPVRRDVASGLPAASAAARAIQRTSLLSRPQLPRWAEVSSIVSAGVDAALRHPADRAALELVDRAVQRVLDRDPP